MGVIAHEVRRDGNEVREYFRYTEKGTGRPKGLHRVGDIVTVETILAIKGEYGYADRKVIGTEEAEIVQITHRIKYWEMPGFVGHKYRDSFYKVRLASGKYLWLGGGFRYHIYTDGSDE